MKKIYTQIFVVVLLLLNNNFLSAQNRTAVSCVTTTAQIDLEVNNVRARILVGGDLWWNPNDNTTGIYEVPKGSGKNCIYAGSLWIGGIDDNGQFRVAAQTYRQTGSNDYWGGPISKTDSINYPEGQISNARCNQFDRLWKINRSEVQNFIAGGTATADMISWPGNGDVANNEIPMLAPFYDANNDGIYNTNDGDYPNFNLSNNYSVNPHNLNSICNNYLLGDQSIWWVFNDIGNTKTQTNSLPIGIEIHAQAFAYSSSNTNINNATFYNYEIINRSNNTLAQFNIGTWCDVDLGDASDDFVGCDVTKGLAFVYNGDSLDNVYGAHCPAAGIMVMQGPFADAIDLIDNNFDGTVDEFNEDCRLSSFRYYTKGPSINGRPYSPETYYNYLNGRWLNGQAITYGGDGIGSGVGATSDSCHFMFPGTSDPLFSTPWTFTTANIQPSDMRFLMTEGSFTMEPGEVNYLTNAVLWAQDTSGGPQSSLQLLKLAATEVQSFFNSCFTTITSVNDIKNNLKISCYPNPFTDQFYIDFRNHTPEKVSIQLYSIDGKKIRNYTTTVKEKLSIDCKDLKQGIYLIDITTDKGEKYTSKIMKQ